VWINPPENRAEIELKLPETLNQNVPISLTRTALCERRPMRRSGATVGESHDVDGGKWAWSGTGNMIKKGNERIEQPALGTREAVHRGRFLVVSHEAQSREVLLRIIDEFECAVRQHATGAYYGASAADFDGLIIDESAEAGSSISRALQVLLDLRQKGLGAPGLIVSTLPRCSFGSAPARLDACLLQRTVMFGQKDQVQVARFVRTATLWRSRFLPFLETRIATSDQLDARHIELVRRYLFLGTQNLPEAMGMGRTRFHDMKKPLLSELDLDCIHLLWRELCLLIPRGQP